MSGDKRSIYFDCFAGAGGDMIVGALLDLGLDFDLFKTELAKLPLDGYSLQIRKTLKCGISAIKFDVIPSPGDLRERHLSDIKKLIELSLLAPQIKEKSIAVFGKLAAAEARIHGTVPEQVHFHEVGAVDSIIDIVGAVTALHLLKIDRVLVSPLPMGHGFVKCQHGVIPVPAPATVELLKGLVTYGSDHEGETVTPTGAALLAVLAEECGPMPPWQLKKVGYGAGTRDFAIPNVVRVILGTESSIEKSGIQPCPEPASGVLLGSDAGIVTVLESNIDDMNPEFYEHVFDLLFSNGALDVFIIPVQMKKNRPGVLLRVLCSEENKERMIDILFRETTTIGVRFTRWNRHCLNREVRIAVTDFGDIRVKAALLEGSVVNAAPEYEDCRKKALEHGVPLKEVFNAALKAMENGTLKFV